MSDRIKFTSHEVKQDKLAEFVADGREKVASHVPIIAGAIAVVVVAAVGIYFVLDSREKSHKAASQGLADAKTQLAGGNLQPALLDLEKISKEFSGDPAAGEALFLLANAHYLNDNFEEAKRRFEEYVSEYSTPRLSVSSAIAGAGACMENTGDHPGAAVKYLAALDYEPKGPAADDYAISALRNYLLAGDRANAQTIYDRMQRDFATSPKLIVAERLFFEITAAPSEGSRPEASPSTGQ